MERYARVTVATRAEWRSWLAAHHGQTDGIWLVTYRKGEGRPYLPWSEIVDEALCFGWIDSLPRKLDQDRTMLLVTPRRAGSKWSAINKAKVERLRRDGLMTLAGERVIARATGDGTWSALDAVETMILPDDLAEALALSSDAHAHFTAFPASSRKGILEWIASARRSGTRSARISKTARLAAQNIRANHPAPRSTRPRG